MKDATTAVLAGQRADRTYNSINLPIYQSATFRFEEPGVTRGFDYTRSGNPTRHALEELLAQLECGAGCTAVASGMAAVSTTLSLFDADSHIVCSHDCYGGTERLLCTLRDQGKLDVTFVDFGQPEALQEALRPDTRALWLETPSNPLLRVVDIRRAAQIAHSAGALLIVDNTFLSPLFQKPLTLGADVVVHSTTKYLNGHSDVVAGAIVAATEERASRLQFLANCLGTTAAPFDSWLVIRGIRTLPLRLRQHENNALRVAQFLEQHPLVERVYYPGLASHPTHAVAGKQQEGYGGVVSFALGESASVNTLLRSTRVFALAESLGGVESLIEHPATMSHASMRPEQREAAGIGESIIRLSVGIEAIEDLLGDLEVALELAATEESHV